MFLSPWRLTHQLRPMIRRAGILNHFLARGPLEAPILFSVDPTVQKYVIKVTKRGPSRSPVDHGWDPCARETRSKRVLCHVRC